MDSHAPAFRSSGLRMAGGTIGSGSPGTAVGSHSTRLSGTSNVTSHQMPRTSNVGNSGALLFAKLDIGGASQRTVPTGGSSLSPRSARIGATPVMAAPSTHGPGSHFAYTDVDQLLNSFDGDLEELSPRGASPRVWGEETAVDASKRDWLGRPQHASTVDISPSRNGLGMTSSSKPRNEGDSSDGFFWTPRDAATTVIPKLDTSIVSPTAAGSSGPGSTTGARNAVTIKHVTTDRSAIAGVHTEGFSGSPVTHSLPHSTVFVAAKTSTLSAILKAAPTRKVALSQLQTLNGAPATILSPRSPRARPKGIATASARLPPLPPTVTDALKHVLTEAIASSGPGKQLPLSESAILGMPLLKDIDALLSSPPPQAVGIPPVCRHTHGTVLHDTDPCSGGPVVHVIDGLLACLEWRFLPAVPAVTDYVAMMDAGRRKWTVQEANKLRTQLEMATQLVDDATDSKSPEVSGATVVQVLLTALHRIVVHSRQYQHLHSQHAIFLHSRSPVMSSIARNVLLSAWQGDAVGSGGSISGIPPGISEVIMSMLACKTSATPSPSSRPATQILSFPPSLYVLDAHCKAMVMYNELVAASRSGGGSKSGPRTHDRWSITVSRPSAWSDLQAQLRTIGVPLGSTVRGVRPSNPGSPAARPGILAPSSLDTPASGSCRLLNPSFTATFKEGGPGKKQVEEGEGHGPRKELFQLIGAQLTASYTDWTRGCGEVSGSEGRNLLTGRFLSWAVPGAKIRDPGGKWSAEIASADASNLRLHAPLSVDVHNDSYEYCTPLKSALVYKSSAEGFWLSSIADDSGGISPEAADGATCLGWLLGAGLVNRCQMGITPARLFFAQIWPTSYPELGGPFVPTEFDLLLHDEGLFQSLRSIRNMDVKTFKSLLAAEDLATSTSSLDYCRHMMFGALVEPYAQQLIWLRHGFQAALGRPGLDVLRRFDVTCDDLQELLFCQPVMIAGFLDIRSLFRIRYDDEVGNTPLLQDALWAIVDSWDVAMKRKFLKFVTGVDTLPSPGIETISIEVPFIHFSIQEHRRALMLLPQSHTCSNSLELPNYHKSLCEIAKLERARLPTVDDVIMVMRPKLTMAVSDGAGYGLDTLGDRSAGAPSSSAVHAITGGPGARAVVDSDSDEDPPSGVAHYSVASSRVTGPGAGVVLLASFDSNAKDSDTKTSEDIIRSARQPSSHFTSFTRDSPPHHALPPTHTSPASASTTYTRAGEATKPLRSSFSSNAPTVRDEPFHKALDSGRSDVYPSPKPPPTKVQVVQVPAIPDANVDGFDWGEVEEMNLL